MHTAAGSGDGHAGRDPRLVVERAPGHTPGMEYESATARCSGRGDQAEIRLEDPFASSRHARLMRQGGVVVLEDLGSTNGTYLNEELLGGPAAAAPRRPRPHRRQRVHVRGAASLMLRVAEHSERTDTGRQRRDNEDAYFARSPLFAVADGMGGAQAGEVASRHAVEVLERRAARRRRQRSRSAWRALVAEANARDPRARRVATTRPRGHGHDADRRLRRRGRGRDRPRRRQPRCTACATASSSA